MLPEEEHTGSAHDASVSRAGAATREAIDRQRRSKRTIETPARIARADFSFFRAAPPMRRNIALFLSRVTRMEACRRSGTIPAKNGMRRTRICLLHPFDPRGSEVGGIETYIRDFIAFHPPDVDVLLIGVDGRGDLALGETHWCMLR